MPCRDYRDDWGHTSDSSSELLEENQVLKERLDYYARMLCHVLGNAEEAKVYGLLIKANNEKSDEVWQWWRNHKQEDAIAKFESEFSESEQEAIIAKYS